MINRQSCHYIEKAWAIKTCPNVLTLLSLSLSLSTFSLLLSHSISCIAHFARLTVNIVLNAQDGFFWLSCFR